MVDINVITNGPLAWLIIYPALAATLPEYFGINLRDRPTLLRYVLQTVAFMFLWWKIFG